MNVRDFADSFLRPYKEKGDEINAETCPYCGSTKDKYKFYLNKVNKTFCCQRATCGAKGHFVELCKKFGVNADRDDWHDIPVKTYKKPEKLPQYTALEIVEQYLKSRGISRNTWERRKVGEHSGKIAMPYYENGEIVLVKYRPAHNVQKGETKSWQSEGGKPVLWGMELCTDKKFPLVIVEGEMDALALDECGVKNVVSVPAGSKTLHWIENCYDFIYSFKEIIFWGDNDEPGREMVRQCQLKLPGIRLLQVKTEYKDANEALLKIGKAECQLLVELAPPMPIEEVIDVADIGLDYDDEDGVVKVKSGMMEIDATIGGFNLGEVSIWTGDAGEGKSTFLGQILLNAIKQNHRVCAYSGELRAKQFRRWLYVQAAGKENLYEYTDMHTMFKTQRVNKDVAEKIREWHRGKLFLYDNRNDQAVKDKRIIPVFRKAVLQFGCTVFLVDNLMTAHFDYGRDRSYYEAQGDFFREVSAFAQAHNVHVHVVAHPRKHQGEISNDDIAGTKSLVNLAQNVFTVSRGKTENSSMVEIKKHRDTGTKDKKMYFRFEPESKRFYMSNEVLRFGWEGQIKPSIFDEMGEK